MRHLEGCESGVLQLREVVQLGVDSQHDGWLEVEMDVLLVWPRVPGGKPQPGCWGPLVWKVGMGWMEG